MYRDGYNSKIHRPFHICIYIYMCVCVCVCVHEDLSINKESSFERRL